MGFDKSRGDTILVCGAYYFRRGGMILVSI